MLEWTRFGLESPYSGKWSIRVVPNDLDMWITCALTPKKRYDTTPWVEGQLSWRTLVNTHEGEEDDDKEEEEEEEGAEGEEKEEKNMKKAGKF